MGNVVNPFQGILDALNSLKALAAEIDRISAEIDAREQRRKPCWK